MLDLKAQQRMLAQLKQSAEPKPVDPALPLKLAMLKAETSALFQDSDDEWWEDARSGDLVQAGLNAVVRWLRQVTDQLGRACALMSAGFPKKRTLQSGTGHEWCKQSRGSLKRLPRIRGKGCKYVDDNGSQLMQ